MKTYEEMAQNALERIHTHKTEQMKRRKTMTKIAAPAVSFCLVAMLCVGAMQSGGFRAVSSLVYTTDSGKVSGQSQTDIPADDSRDAPKADMGEDENTDSTDSGKVSGQSQTDIPADDSRDAPKANMGEDENTDSKDSGKVSGQSQTDTPADDSRDAPKADSGEDENTDSKNHAGDTTVQQGVDNSSGNACCLFWWHSKLRMSGPLYWAIEADPNGNFDILATYCPTTADITSFNYEGKTLAQWAIEAEDERMREVLEKDIAAYDEQTARNGYKLAYNAYMESVIPKEVIRLSNSGIKCERADGINNGIVFTVTADELENLPLADLINWTFNLN